MAKQHGQVLLPPGHAMDRPDPRDIIKDPEFHTLPMNDRIQLMSQADPDFKSLAPPDQMDIVQRAEQQYGRKQDSGPDVSGAIGNFLSGAARNLNPMNMLDAAKQSPPGYDNSGQLYPGAVGRGVDNILNNMIEGGVKEFGKAKAQWQKGNPLGAAGYAASSVAPVGMGPVVSHAVERGFGLNHDTGSTDPNISPDPAGGLGEAAGLVAPAALGKAGRWAAPYVEDYGAAALGKGAGVGGKPIKIAANAAISHPDFEPSLKRKPGYDNPMDVVNDARAAFKNLKDTRRQEYLQNLSQIPQNPLDTTAHRMGFMKDLTNEYGIKVKPPSPKNPSGKLDFSSAAMSKSGPLVQQAFDDVMQWDNRQPGNTTPAGLDTLKQRLDDYYEHSLVDGKPTKASTLILRAKNRVRDTLNQAPGYKDATSKYHAASEFIDRADQELGLADGKNPGTVIRKLAGALNQNNEYRQVVLDALSNETGKDLVGRVAGTAMSDPYPKGLTGALRGAGVGVGIGGAALLHHPELIPVAVGGAALTSPRVLGEAFNAISKLRRNHVPNTIRGAAGAAYDAGRLVRPNPQHDDSGPPAAPMGQAGPALAPPSSLPNQGFITQ